VTITLSPELEAALRDLASRRGVSPEELALAALRERFLTPQPIVPRDEWERGLLAIACDCGVSLTNEALGREEMYD
jgi:predicted transcriptional regulator